MKEINNKEQKEIQFKKNLESTQIQKEKDNNHSIIVIGKEKKLDIKESIVNSLKPVTKIEIISFKDQGSIEKLNKNQDEFLKDLTNLCSIFQNYYKESKSLMDNFNNQKQNNVI